MVPRLTEETARASEALRGWKPGGGSTTPAGLEISIEEPETLGVDLLAADAAAAAEYPLPVVVFDFGTATTVTVVDRQRRYRGGVILAGVKLSLHACSPARPSCPDIALEPPGKGHLLRYGGQPSGRGHLRRRRHGRRPAGAHGGGAGAALYCRGHRGLSGIITPYCRRRIRHDDSLLLRGLALIWRKNCENR